LGGGGAALNAGTTINSEETLGCRRKEIGTEVTLFWKQRCTTRRKGTKLADTYD
jgi:hypothetical protein